jgi:hypothetical protein
VASLTGIGEIADLAKDALDRFVPNKSEEEKQQMAAMMAVVQGQIQTNQNEAKSASVFVAGWRPMVGWVAAISLALVYWPKAIVLSGVWTYQCIIVLGAWHGVGTPTLPAYPDLGVSDLIGLLGSLLGMGTMRTIETLQGVQRASIKGK